MQKLEFYIGIKYLLSDLILGVRIKSLHYMVPELFYTPATFAWSLLYIVYIIFILNSLYFSVSVCYDNRFYLSAVAPFVSSLQAGFPFHLN